MSLVSKFEIFFVSNIVHVLVLLVGILASLSWWFLIGSFRVYFACQVLMIHKQLACVYFSNSIDRDVWRFVFEAAVHIDVAVHAPGRVAEPLDGLEFVPLARFSVVYFKGDVFSDLVGPAADDHHKRAEEQRRVLIAWRRHLTRLVRGLYPVPSAVAMSAKAPSVAK